MMPSALESEAQVLGGVILQAAVLPEVTDLIAPEDFYSTVHAAIFSTVLEMVGRGEHLDPLTIARAARGGEGVDPLLVAELCADVVTPAAAIHHARIVRQTSRLRALAIVGSDLGSAAVKPGADPDALVEKAESELFRVAVGLREHTPWEVSLANALAGIEHQYQTGQLVTGIPTGIQPIDDDTSGLQPGWLTYVAARPGVGKTAFLMQAAVRAAREYPVMVASLEMSAQQLAQRTLCTIAGISYSQVRHGTLDDKGWERLIAAEQTLAGLPIEVFDRLETVAQIRSRVRRHKPSLLIVDYVQLIRERRATNREDEISRVSRGLKLMAEDQQLSVFAAAQLNRKPEAEGRPPNLSDLRGSGSLEQDADVVFLMHRQEDGTNVTFDMAKFRHGPTSRTVLRWNPAITKFHESDVGML